MLSKVRLIMSEDVVIPRLDDRQKVHLSKALSYILRHGATKEKLVMTDDGYVQVQEIVSEMLAFFFFGKGGCVTAFLNVNLFLRYSKPIFFSPVEPAETQSLFL